MFSLAHLLGFRFVPRLRDFADRKIGTFEGQGRYPSLASHKQGRLRDRAFEDQALKASGLNFVTAAIVYWNTLYMGRVVEHLRRSGEPAPDELLAHVGPLGWRHISLTGDYLWQNAGNGVDDDGFRPLNLSIERIAKVA